jgi:glycogen debranching enzyme
MKHFLALVLVVASLSAMAMQPASSLAEKIKTNSTYPLIMEKAKTVMKTGFNAGDGYGEVWIRDYNTFIDLACDVYDPAAIKENLLVFFNLQGTDGNIVDGFIPKSKAGAGYDYIYTKLEPRYAGHKNTVETDQETSLIQAIYKYVKHTGKKDILTEKVGDKTVAVRMEEAMEYLLNHRYSARYGLIWGATTADWGDVQPEHEWGVYLTSETHYAIDIYDNAMFVIALDNIMELLPETAVRWKSIREGIAKNARKYLWDAKKQKFIPHIYLNGSPFSPSLDENAVFYHGGTAVAIEAGLLSKAEIKISLDKMIQNVKASGAGSIGLTMYPPYPQGAFMGKGMYPYGYQNGGDWTWFGARMIQQLVRYGFVKEAYEQLQPMVDRVKANNGFYEWYSVDNKPSGSGTFRGEAGVLYKSIEMLYDWANKVK